MKRWHNEITLMERRWHEEVEDHRDTAFGYVHQGCHCLRGMGTTRKNRPFASHSSKTCGMCAGQRQEKHRVRRAGRYQGKRELRLEFAA